MKISGMIITSNSDRWIEGSIGSVRDIVDDLVIIDTGSTDYRHKIVIKHTKKIYRVSFKGNFSIIRNYVLSRSIEDWTLVLDSDEVLSIDAHIQISRLVENRDLDGYWFRRRWYWDKTHYLKHGLFYPDYQLRLFRNKPEYRYIHRVHEELTIPKEKTKQVAVDIYHYNSLQKYLSWKGQKQLRLYITLAALDFKDLKKPRLWYLWKTIYTFIDMFFVGLTRGKGILDGWIGIKAHFFFALSISKAYWKALMDKTGC